MLAVTTAEAATIAGYADLRIFLSDLCRNVREGNRDGKPGEPFQKLCESDR